MSAVTLLGPQYHEPNLVEALRHLSLPPPYAVVSAGWQEREGEIDELQSHVGGDAVDLRVYARTEEAFASDRELRVLHRQKQGRLQEMQDLYRLRLDHAKTAARELFSRDARSAAVRAARREAIGAVRRLDRTHLAAVRTVHSDFDARVRPLERPALRHVRARIDAEVARCSAVLVAGGHVAVLVNRLRLLGGNDCFGGRPVVAWSAGAMACAEVVVLFHDAPPQGAANVEVLDAGLVAYRGVVPFPHSRHRLALHDTARVAMLARRFAPAACVTLDHGAWISVAGDGRIARAGGSFRLARDGTLAAPLAA
jgi:hypothetical protein